MEEAKIQFYDKLEAISLINALAADDKSFVFAIDYAQQCVYIQELKDVDPRIIKFDFRGVSNAHNDILSCGDTEKVEWNVHTPTYESYKRNFDIVEDHIRKGDSYLTNLTACVPIETNLSLSHLYKKSKAVYKFMLEDRFVCFSPEPFVRIEQGKIYSFPMKGTIDAALPDAEKKLIEDDKEAAEHATIVDLIRNDLSKVADHVDVERYRYIDELETNKGKILQTSSKISGLLPQDYKEHLGDILFSLLPAGSITGAPKKKTMNIISEAEQYNRGFYSGVMGCYSDNILDSAVMIRFIENNDGNLYFKAGGGITSKSDCRKEYNELIQKIYVPIY